MARSALHDDQEHELSATNVFHSCARNNVPDRVDDKVYEAHGVWETLDLSQHIPGEVAISHQFL